MKKLLITGFDPFNGESVNPSWEAVKALPAVVGDYALYKLELPTVYAAGPRKAMEAAEAMRPDAILAVGQAGGRKAITPEVIGINLREASITDNAGVLLSGVPIAPEGPAAYFSTLPVREMVKAVAALGIPAALSYSAGAFVCNDVLYSLLHRFHGTGIRVGFIHVPFLPEQVKNGEFSLPKETIIQALCAAIETI